MKWYVVISRLEFDDEDSCYMGQHGDKEQALEAAEAWLRQGEDRDSDTEPKLFYWNYVLECESEPTIVGRNTL